MKRKKIPFLEFVVALCILLNCECIWKWMNHSGYFKLVLDSCFIASLFILVTHGGLEIAKKNIKVLNLLIILLLGLVFYNLCVNSKHALDALQIVIIIILMFLYTSDYTRLYSVLERCSKILCVLAMVSLFFWIFGSVLHIFSPNQSIVVYNSNVARIRQSYFFLHYEVQTEELLGNSIFRNTGIFYEGPKYVLLLSLFLMYELYISKKCNLKRSVIFTITAITTMSMTGIYAIMLIWFLYLLYKFPAASNKGIILRGLIVLLAFAFGIQIVSYVEDFLSLKAATASYNTRIDNYQAGFLAWKEHPFMGAGYLNMSTIQSHYSIFRLNDIGYSNSVFRLLAQGGIYLAIIYIVPIVKVIKESILNKYRNMISFVIIFVYFFITTSFTYNYIMFLVLCLMYFDNVDMRLSENVGE